MFGNHTNKSVFVTRNSKDCEILGSQSFVGEVPRLLRRGATSQVEWFPASRSNEYFFLDCFSLEDEVLQPFETLGTTHPRARRHVPKDSSSQIQSRFNSENSFY
jgi:hypothetical protein